jgi:DNA-binding NtrC family response regulator
MSPTDDLDRLLQLSANELDLESVWLRVDTLGHFAAQPLASATTSALTQPAGVTMAVTLPLCYAGSVIGELGASLRGQVDPDSARRRVQDLARRGALLAQRCEVHRWLVERLDASPLLVGHSAALQRVEADIERACKSNLPVLLHGEFGTETLWCAAAVHALGPRRAGPFVRVRCGAEQGDPKTWVDKSCSGSLLLEDVGDLPLAVQEALLQVLPSEHGHSSSQRCAPRIMVSTTVDLRQRVSEGRFSRRLLAELDFLPLQVPPLRERLDDIEPLVLAVLQRRGFNPARKCSPELIAICRHHTWPENLSELERVIARLAAMTGDRAITAEDVQRYTPWLAVPTSLDLALALASTLSLGLPAGRLNGAAPHPAPAASPERWLHSTVAQDAAELGKLHDSLRKALVYLSQHYAEPISLPLLARQAHVSPSHLTHLFRSRLGMAFKPFLSGIRVHKAKEILISDSRQRITDVALSVGFGDLSHFEKSFRRRVGQSPREFRRHAVVGLPGHDAAKM